MSEIKIIAFEDIFQHEAMKKGIYTEDYLKLSAKITMDKQDMEKVNAKDGQNVKLENDVGSIVVTAKLEDGDSHPGLAFMNTSPWINQLVREDFCETGGRPDHITVTISPSDQEATKLAELLERIKRDQ